ncbi:hypothetical protein BC832DRAFT_564635 [Gaertneriomyces semiglobifer]|nr:hypothetical protein BC832DRAFT_564635 [Gaertneriomyces semiglobifer]
MSIPLSILYQYLLNHNGSLSLEGWVESVASGIGADMFVAHSASTRRSQFLRCMTEIPQHPTYLDLKDVLPQAQIEIWQCRLLEVKKELAEETAFGVYYARHEWKDTTTAAARKAARVGVQTGALDAAHSSTKTSDAAHADKDAPVSLRVVDTIHTIDTQTTDGSQSE